MAPTFVSGIPIYVQIADDIRAQILRGTLRAGDQLTSTTEYSATYRINPATVGKAFAILVDEGLVDKRRGIGMFVAKGARRALVADGMSRSEIAILYRSNAQSRILEHTLFSAGVPYKVYGGLRFFERAEIKHALAYLRLIENPDDDGAFLRVVNFPARGIGARTLENLQDTARTHGISLYRAVPMTSGIAAPARASGEK